MTVLIGAIPVGATLSDGTNSFTATSGKTSVDVTLWTLSALTVTPPADSGADFTLAVTAISTETSNGDEATIKGDLSVSVSAVADAPTLTSPTPRATRTRPSRSRSIRRWSTRTVPSCSRWRSAPFRSARP